MDIKLVLVITLAVLNLVLLASIYMFVKNMGRAQLFSRLMRRGTLTQRQLDAQRPARLAENIEDWDEQVSQYNDPRLLNDVLLNVINASNNVTQRPDIYGRHSSQILSNLKKLETKILTKMG